jgi:hypothetical protein
MGLKEERWTLTVCLPVTVSSGFLWAWKIPKIYVTISLKF